MRVGASECLPNILFNGNNATQQNYIPNLNKFLTDLAEVKQVNISDLHSFLECDHTSFTTLNVSTKHIASTNRIVVSLTKNSARSFYLKQLNSVLAEKTNPPKIDLKDDCLTDAQNCQFFQFFNSKEKKLYTRFSDNFEANFFCSCLPEQCPHQYLFLTGTYNKTAENLAAWTTNWNEADECWEILKDKVWLKEWAQQFDPQAEPLKVDLPPTPEDARQFTTIKKHFAQLIRDINRIWKPSQWKWAVIFELQKNGHWHWHLFTTPFIPYSHKCVLASQKTQTCWNCRTYLNSLWTYGRVESRSLDRKAAGKYMAKYLAKSFHLRNLYRQHGLTDRQRAYHFYQNLYDYEQRPVKLAGKSKIDQLTGQKLNSQQTIFRHYDYTTEQTSYYYRTNKIAFGKCAKPTLIKKNYRLATRTLYPLSLLKLAKKDQTKPVFKLLKTPLKKKNLSHDFQEFLISKLLLLCKTAEFTHVPLEQEQVWKEGGQCSGTVYSHFQTKPVLRFTFASEQAAAVREFIAKLDEYADEYEMEESKDFYFYPTAEAREIWTPEQARNCYLDRWQTKYCRDNFYSFYPHPINP